MNKFQDWLLDTAHKLRMRFDSGYWGEYYSWKRKLASPSQVDIQKELVKLQRELAQSWMVQRPNMTLQEILKREQAASAGATLGIKIPTSFSIQPKLDLGLPKQNNEFR